MAEPPKTAEEIKKHEKYARMLDNEAMERFLKQKEQDKKIQKTKKERGQDADFLSM